MWYHNTGPKKKKKKSHHLYCQRSCVLKGPVAQFVDRLQQEGSPPRRFDIIDVEEGNTLPVP